MRRLAAALWLLAAACSVPLEGAPCTTDANCPDTQRCDAGTRACVTCVADPACTADGFSCAGLHTIRECRTNGGTCRYSQMISCGSLDCDVPTGSCPCLSNSGQFVADPVQGSAAGPPFFPTGNSSPPQCRFRRLGDALAAASAGDTVRMTGWTAAAAEVKFSASASGESFPLTVKPGVTLTTTDASPVPAHYAIEVDQPGATLPVLQLDHDAAASGFTIRPGGGGTASDAVLVNCSAAGAGPVTLASLVLDGKGSLPASALDDGLNLKGPCSVTASSLLVEGAAKAGIRVESSVPPAGSSSVSISISTIRGNGDGGLVVNVDASNGRPSLSVTGNEITGNSATTSYTDTTVTPNVTRKGGGVVLLAAVPNPLVFTGNRVHGNSFDQLLVWSDNTWGLSVAACGATSNVFACYDTQSAGGPWVGLSALGGSTVNALNESWAYSVPQSGRDYFRTTTSTVDASSPCSPSVTCP